MLVLETPQHIEPTRLEATPATVADAVAELSAETAVLGAALHPRTAANLADLVRVMNAYYSNLIEGHVTHPRDIVRALAGELDTDQTRRNLQIEAAAHVRVQAELDRMGREDHLPEPASRDFLRWLHREFYGEAPAEMLVIRGADRAIRMEPGAWRSRPEHEVAVGRHMPPSSERVEDFMVYFEEHYRFAGLGKASRVLAIAAAHHRFNYIHPFPDGNGRVSRLMSHAMAHAAGIGAHGLWSISRGLARGIDGRGDLSQRALADFTLWFLQVALDQVRFMSALLALDTLALRLRTYVERSETLRPQAGRLLEEALTRGAFERGEAARITGLPERTARRVVNDVVAHGLLGSDTPKGPLSLRFPEDALDVLFPRLFPET